ncbi:MAG: glycosyltransferase family 9 protein [Proteobacteria bacterium]|nr:glycosyltransferase family 9 protein [Pseudomonadota bacterium]MCH9711353.1 glycosyltransferase family 9 protein [Pseudomonadota bacterium]MCH9749342.1 glycosyltransferase family 9 protein [Pseudomonadota bacterium]
MRILILKVQTIGDTLLTTPLISNLYRYYDNPVIDVMVNEGTEQMLTLNNNVREVIQYKRVSQRSLSNFQRLSKNIQLLKKIRRAQYDLVIDLDEGDRGAFVTLVSGAKVKVGSSTISSHFLRSVYIHLLPKRNNRHTVEIDLDPLRLLNIPIVDKQVEIFWSKEDGEFVAKKLIGIKQFIHIHPFSKGWFKDIDIQTTAKIIDYCEQELDIKVVITAAPIQRELDKLGDILKLCQSKPINLGGKLSLKQTAVLNSKAKLFIGVDTAIMHISAANNIPTLAFFGPTAPDTWGPWDNDLGQTNYYRNGGLQVNGKHRVLSDVRTCLPCNNEGCDNNQVSDCLIGLDIHIIKKNINEMVF